MANSHNRDLTSKFNGYSTFNDSLNEGLVSSVSSVNSETKSHQNSLKDNIKYLHKQTTRIDIVDNEQLPEQSNSWLSPATKESLWNGFATGIGTAAWMGGYYLKDYFQFWGLGGYFLNSLFMGIISNIAALPFVYIGQRAAGETHKDSLRITWQYFWLCLFPDSLYEPTADIFIALCKMWEGEEFDFVKYADPMFSGKEISVSFGFFVTFGLVFYAMKKKLFKDEASNEENDIAANTCFLKFLKAIKPLFAEGSASEAAKITIQYWMFYGTDYLFDTDLGQGTSLIYNLLSTCVVMAGFCVGTDKLFEYITAGITKLENYLNHQQRVQQDVQPAEAISETQPSFADEEKSESSRRSSNDSVISAAVDDENPASEAITDSLITDNVNNPHEDAGTTYGTTLPRFNLRLYDRLADVATTAKNLLNTGLDQAHNISKNSAL